MTNIIKKLDIQVPPVPVCRCCGKKLGLERFYRDGRRVTVHFRCLNKHSKHRYQPSKA